MYVTWTSSDRPFGQSVNVYLNNLIIRCRVVQMDRPQTYIWMVQKHGVKASIRTAKFCPNGQYMFVSLDASKSMVQGCPNGQLRDVQVDLIPN